MIEHLASACDLNRANDRSLVHPAIGFNSGVSNWCWGLPRNMVWSHIALRGFHHLSHTGTPENGMPTPLRANRCFLALLLALPSAISAQSQIRPPLHTSGHAVLDSAGHLVRLTSVNWYGFDQKEFVAGGLDHAPLATIITKIQEIGVNSVRLPWANETLERNPQVPDYAVKANPQFRREACDGGDGRRYCRFSASSHHGHS